MQTIAGFQNASEGKAEVIVNGSALSLDKLYTIFAFAAPYSELPELLTSREIIEFHNRIQHKELTVSEKEFLTTCFLEKHADKPIKYFSSGMKQRLKLGLAIFAKSPILLLDEPTSNLDDTGIKWYQKLLYETHFSDKILIVASNQIEIDLPDYDVSIDLTK